MFVVKVLSRLEDMEPPKEISDYILGYAGLPSLTSAVKTYHKWLQTRLNRQKYRVYRAFTYGAPVDEGDDIFAHQPMSFTESKATAMAIAKERHEDQPDLWVYVVEMEAPKDRIYFHYQFGGKVGAEHPKEKEIMVLARNMSFDIVKEYTP